MNELERSAGLPATANYRYADRVGDELFVAGQVPHNSQRELVGLDDVGAQATKCLDNLSQLIQVYEFELADIRRLIVYVVGEQNNLTTAWSVVTDWFDGVVPPATLLGVNLLGHDRQLVEVDATIRKEPTT